MTMSQSKDKLTIIPEAGHGGNMFIGYSGRGTFLQSGGEQYIRGSDVYLGYNPGSSGTYELVDGWAKLPEGGRSKRPPACLSIRKTECMFLIGLSIR